MPLVLGDPPSIRIVAPMDGSRIRGGTVNFVVEAPGRYCLQLTNKRVSWDSYVHCADARRIALDGFTRGVWRCRGILGANASMGTYRGEIFGEATSETWFQVDTLEVIDEGPTTKRLLRQNGLDKAIHQEARGCNLLVVSAANGAHVALALNLVYSVRRAGDIGILVFALSKKAEVSFHQAGVATWLLVDGDDQRRDVQTPGFAQIAVAKPVIVALVLRAGVDAIWADTDVVFFSSPLFVAKTTKNQLLFQAGSRGPLEVPETREAEFHVEFCTGLYYARGLEAADFLVAVAHDLERLAQDTSYRDWIGDQAATNLLAFELRFRGPDDLTIGTLDAYEFPAGGIFFQSNDDLPNARLAHNNFIVGEAKKLERFRQRGLWFAESQPYDFRRTLDLAHPFTKRRTAASLIIDRRRVDDDGVFLWSTESVLKDRAIVVVSIGERPWWPALAERVKAYARRVDADVLGVTSLRGSTAGEAKRIKLVVARDAFAAGYRRILILDDTVAIRNDTPNLFAKVPEYAIGATIEDFRIRKNAQVLARLSSLKYSSCTNDVWFNSGVVVLSWVHAGMLTAIPSEVRDELFWDQGILNARRSDFRFPLVDLGYEYNYVGSFETTNQATAPFPSATEAYMVHGTTGLLRPPEERRAYLEDVLMKWSRRGL